MRPYRVTAHHRGDSVDAVAEVHGWVITDRTWSWLPVDEWSIPCAEGDHPAPVLAASLLERGWRTQASNIRFDARHTAHLDVTIGDYDKVLTHLSEHRRTLAERSRAVNAAMQNVIADAPPLHHAGYLGDQRIGALLHLTRARVWTLGDAMTAAVTDVWRRATPSEKSALQARLTLSEQARLDKKS